MERAILKTLPEDSHRRVQCKTVQALAIVCMVALPFMAQAIGEPIPEMKPVMETTTVNTPSVKTITATNLMHPEESVFTSGQPSKEELQAMAKAGIKHVINLRPDAEMEWDERQLVESLGMTYAQLPIASAADLTVSNAEALDNLLTQTQGEPVLLHCASGNRIGAVIAVREAKLKNKDLEQAIGIGKQWGLTKLEPQVREVLSAP